MKTSLEWLGEYVSGPIEPTAAADALTNGGLNVDAADRIGDDTVLDIDVTSNRGDCLCHLGIARELAALQSREFRPVAPAATEIAAPAAEAVKVRIDAPALCPQYTARVIRGVKIGPSPAWMVRRLEAVGLRPINSVVDVTNYVMFEMGQPLHAFDFAKIAGRQIIVREARKGEKLISIDGHERQLTPRMLVIADAEKPVALAGVMGGRDSEVSDATRDVLLESARFDPLSVRKTSRALALKSDSSYRFERGIDPTLPARASLRAAQLILQTAGGELLLGIVQAGSEGYSPKALSLRLARMRQLLGVEISTDAAMGALSRLQLSPMLRGDRIDVTVPSWRLDLNIEVDLIEEVARVVGYDKIPVKDEIAIRLTPPDLATRTIDLIRENLVAAGYFEAITVSFVSDALKNEFQDKSGSSAALRADASVRKADASLRPSLLPGLVEAVRRNETAGVGGARLFEIGSTFSIAPSGEVDERRRIGIVGSSDVRDVRGTVELLLNRLDADRDLQVEPDARAGFARGACGRIEWGGKPIGYLGKIDRAVAEKLSLREIPAAAELELTALLEGARHVPQLHPLPRFPEVRRDVSLVVAENVRYEPIEATIRAVRPPFLEQIEYVTSYRGKPLEAGTKSVTVTLVFRSPTTTLTGEQVEAAVQQVIAAAKEQLGATLRA